jgi:hypothetical protein
MFVSEMQNAKRKLRFSSLKRKKKKSKESTFREFEIDVLKLRVCILAGISLEYAAGECISLQFMDTRGTLHHVGFS